MARPGSEDKSFLSLEEEEVTLHVAGDEDNSEHKQAEQERVKAEYFEDKKSLDNGDEKGNLRHVQEDSDERVDPKKEDISHDGDHEDKDMDQDIEEEKLHFSANTHTTRSGRVVKPSLKVRENNESESCAHFWKMLDDCKLAMRTIQRDLDSDTPPVLIDRMRKYLEDARFNLCDSYAELRTVLTSVPQEIRQANDRCVENVNHLEKKLNGTFLPEKSEYGSHRSQRTGSSLSSERLLLTAKKAGLKAQLDARKAKATHRLKVLEMEAEEQARRARYEAERNRLKEEAEDHLLEAELAKADAELQALEENSLSVKSYLSTSNHHSKPEQKESKSLQMLKEESNLTVTPKSHLKDSVPSILPTEDNKEVISSKPQMNKILDSVTLKPQMKTSLPTDSDDDSSSLSSVAKKASDVDFSRLLQTFAHSVNRSRLPAPEPDMFTGNPLEFPAWKASFSSLIESRDIAPNERIHFLRRYLKGEAKECVSGLFYANTEESYQDAWQLLEKRFGNTFLIAEAFREKLSNWQKMEGGDGKAIRKYSDYLSQCLMAKRQIPELSILDDCHEIRDMKQKLPKWARREWATKVTAGEKPYPAFSEFVKFVNKLAERLCNPLTAEDLESESPKKFKQKGSARALAVKEEKASPTEPVKKENHKPPEVTDRESDARKFVWRNDHAKKQYFMKRGLCFTCEQHGHLSKDCPQNPNRVSSENSSEKVSAVTASNFKIARNTSHSKSTLIVPVYVSSCTNPEEEFLVYALLDTQSDTTFILKDVAKTMKSASSIPVELELTTLHSTSLVPCEKLNDLKIRGMYSSETVSLPSTYTTETLPSNRQHIPTADVASKWSHLKDLAIPPMLDCRIGLLIGYDCPSAFLPTNVVKGSDNEPFAIQTILGWSIVGTFSDSADSTAEHRGIVSHVSAKEEVSAPTSHILRLLELDFQDTQAKSEKSMSQEDWKFLDIMRGRTERDENGFYMMPLPFRQGPPELPNNFSQAKKRLLHLKRKFLADADYLENYSNFMSEVISRNEAESVPHDEMDKTAWYIPHHGVRHKTKKKLRVVFDCSARCGGTSLNEHLLQGPDLMNSLLGCLLRFREYPFAVAGDIERMFYRFKVSPDDRDYLRFLWWEQGLFDSEPMVYRMTVHLFGARSSPACANYALKKLAADHAGEFSEEICKFLRDEFYVDDGLVSCSSARDASDLINGARELCQKANIRLHKIISNSQDVMNAIPVSERAKDVDSVDLPSVAVERILGIQWNVKSDIFQFSLTLDPKPMTRRGILSTVSSIFDPLGCLAPFTILGKQILQDMCRTKAGWDDPLPEELRPRWGRWLADFPSLVKITIPRCYIPQDFGEITRCEVHHFSDASSVGYGQGSYLRVFNNKKQVHSCLLMGKARVAPLKDITIPRLELTAAVTSIKVARILREELRRTPDQEVFWTDSKIVIGYIRNDERRFHVFVSNRIRQIKSSSDVDQWRYVSSQENPADHASRGLYASELMRSNWFTGPEFLQNPDLPELDPAQEVSLSPDDPELKKVSVYAVQKNRDDSILRRLEKFSDWMSLITAVAVIQRFLKKKQGQLTQTDRLEAEETVIRLFQREIFHEEIQLCTERKTLPKSNRLYQLEPFMDERAILRVGGRIRNCSISYGVRHPVILTGHLAKIVIAYCHRKVAHQGRGFTMNEVRARGFWVLGLSRAVSSYIYGCIICKKLRGKTLIQKMADLPPDRLEVTAPYTYVGLDCFGPFTVKDVRREVKRYGLIITCMSSRAVHIECLDDMSTDCFINSLRCFIALRGPVRQIRCDQGSNFIGAKRIFDRDYQAADEKLKSFLAENRCDFVLNSPHSSHMGGCWERHIRTARNILSGLLEKHGSRLDTSSLRTLFYEVTAIMNSRPLTAQNLSDPAAPEPLTPNHLINMKPSAPPPPGDFVKEDTYARLRWRRVQRLADEFWRQWKAEYLLTLQKRSKWEKKQRNLEVGDIVLLKDDQCRCDWKLARITETMMGSDGLVRRVKLLVGDSQLSPRGQRVSNPTILERPVHKLVLLLEND